MLLPPTWLSFGMPVCKSNLSGWFRSQGKYRATFEFKSSECAVSNNLIYDSNLKFVSFSQSYPKIIWHVLTQPGVTASNWCVRG